MSDAWKTELVQKAMSDAAGAFAQMAFDHFGQFVRSAAPRVSLAESPIEAVFWVWWQMFAAASPYNGMFMPDLVPQWNVSAGGATYRLDFAVFPGMLAVELDGHQFHERTREQVEYRNRRDRDLGTDGWFVMHFSGSEVARDPQRVVREVLTRWRALQPSVVGQEPSGRPSSETTSRIDVPLECFNDRMCEIANAWLDEISQTRRFFYGTVIAQVVSIIAGDGVIRLRWRPGHEKLRDQAITLSDWMGEIASRIAGKPIGIEFDGIPD